MTHTTLPAAALFTLAIASVASAQPAGSPVPRQIVVKVSSNQSAQALANAFGSRVIASIPAHGIYVLQGPSNHTPANTQAMRNQLQNDGRVGAAEQNRYVRSPEGTTQSFFVSVAPSEYPSQPSRDLLGLPQMAPAATGDGVRIAVLDTGFSPHHAINNPILPGYNYVSFNADTSDIGNGLDDDADDLIDELTGHGTMVAGIIALAAPRASIMPVKVLDSDGIGTTFTVAAGLYLAADSGVNIVNLSLATPQQSSLVKDAITYATGRGITVVAAAGNDNSDQHYYPACYPGVIAVAATDLLNQKAAFSNYGPAIDLCAPGTDVVSTVPGEGFASASGTSFAAAWVSGILCAGGTLESTTPTINLSPVIRTAMSLDLLNPAYAGRLGVGSINAGAAFPPPLTCGSSDFDGDGDLGTDRDILAFFACMGGYCCASCNTGGADFNADGESGTDADIEAFFRVLGGGAC